MKKRLNIVTLVAMFFTTSMLTGCGDSDNVKTEFGVWDVSVRPQALTIAVGETAQLSVFVDAHWGGPKWESGWESSNPSVADLDNSLVTGVSPGRTTITHWVDDKSASCELTVVAAKEK
jgi:uncharacterized protein YjdB